MKQHITIIILISQIFFGFGLTLSHAQQGREWKKESVLASGEWFKIGVTKSGIYRLNGADLEELGLPAAQINPKNVKIYGAGGNMLPQSNNDPIIDDLIEFPVKLSANSNNSFDESDYLLFFAEGPHGRKFNTPGVYNHQKNDYCDTAYYFITYNANSEHKKIQSRNAGQNPDIIRNTFDYLTFHEMEQRTRVSDEVKTGRDWFGEDFSTENSQTFNLDLPSKALNVKSKIAVAARSGSPTTFYASLNGNSQEILKLSSVDLTEYESNYVDIKIKSFETELNGSEVLNYSLDYMPSSSSDLAWLNYISAHAECELNFNGSEQFLMHDLQSETDNFQTSAFEFSSKTGAMQVWHVGDLTDIYEVPELPNNTFSFETSENNRLIAFEPGNAYSPLLFGKMQNQNLHSKSAKNLLILTGNGFKPAAEQLGQFHQKKYGLSYEVINVRSIYNEFSGGRQDISALRNFCKMWFDREPGTFKYLFLVGDASYDYKDRLNNNTNIVPTYQTNSSFSPIGSYASDDYFAYLQDNEGDLDSPKSSVYYDLDIAVGRLPALSVEDINIYYNKLLRYHSAEAQGSWRNDIVFIADDEDNGSYVRQSEEMTRQILKEDSALNVHKIYLDAYQQQSTANGTRYPNVNDDFKRSVNDGALILNYIGHGGETGLAHEKILTLEEINSWRNKNKLPVFITATCEFTRFDDPARVSAGERVLLNKDGGAIAMLSTTRLVFSGSNERLLEDMFEQNMFSKDVNPDYCVGDIVNIAKNRSDAGGINSNTRKFAIMGTPALRIAFPKYNAVTTNIINENAPGNSGFDSLKALSKVTIEGEILDDQDNLMPAYEGTIYPTVFDKPIKLQTLKNDPGSRIQNFSVQDNVLFRGKASVKEGRFKFSFVVPKDIAYNIGNGKVNYYFTDGMEDGNGKRNVIIGGTAEDPIVDNKPPQVSLFMNDIEFNFGGTVNEDPVMIAKVYDENGINTVSNSVGHEPRAYLNDKESIVLREGYTSEEDDYQNGEIRYQFFDLAPGRYRLALQVYDVANNLGEGYTEFIVADSSQLVINELFNYPNPMVDVTTFRFNHNMPNEDLNVSIRIFDQSGRLVTVIREVINTEGSVADQVTWDGTSNYGHEISRGIYSYQVKLSSRDGKIAEQSEKLVIIK